jgi:TonB-linked SusC/RagA family outer membrane protein
MTRKKTNKSLEVLRGAILVAGLLCAGMFSLHAQRNVTGLVSDESGGMSGVNITVKGTNVGTLSDADGKYSIAAPDGDAVLVFSLLGYATREIAVGGRTVVDVAMSELAEEIDELVVVAYGTQKKANLSGAVTQIGSRELENRPIQNVSSALQGLMTGVTVLSGEGRPGLDGATIRVRGLGTLNTGYAGPYILIDGVESGTMNAVDPNDIENISVLKDASSAAIYGSKASNGVILITTKRGKANDKPRVTYSGYFGIQQATNLVERMSSYDYARLFRQAQIEHGDSPRFTEDDIAKFRDGSDPYGHPNTDWYGLAFQTGTQHRHNVNISGGTAGVSYMASAGFLQQSGILPNSDRQQFNGRTNIEAKLSEKFTARLNLAFVKNDYRDPTNSYVGGGSDQIVRQLNIIAPWIPYKNADGSYGTIGDGNPVAWLDVGQTLDRYNQNFTGLLALDYKIVPGLVLSLQGAYVSNVQHYKEFRKEIQYNPSKYHGPNQSEERYYLWDRLNFDVLLNYDKSFDRHNFKLMAGWHTEDYNYKENGMIRKQFPNNDLTDINAGAESTQTNNGFTRRLAMISGFGRLNYDYAGKYLLEANFRADASSRFAPDNRWGYFPSFSAAWRLSEEGFMDSLRERLNSLKLRASWGLLGDQAANGDYYPYLNTYNLSGSYPFGGQLQSGYYQSSFKIQTFSWEQSRTVGIGMDLTLFKHFSASVDYYNRKTSGIIMDVPVPKEFGLGAYKDNIGEVSNRGVELNLAYNKQWNEWRVSASANVSHNKNEVLDLGMSDKSRPMIDGNTIKKVGHQINSYYVYQTDGLLRSQAEVDAFNAKYNQGTGTTMFSREFKPGDLKYVDVNNDGKINENDRVICNSTTPAWTFGLNLSLGFKRFDLSMLFSGAAKVARIYNNEVFGVFTGDNSHPSTYWLDAWSESNSSSNVPRVWFDRYSNSDPRNIMSTFWVRNTSYVRMKNLQLGYNFPARLLSGAGISALRVYFSAENLFTIDALPLSLDPETSSERASSYPLARTQSIGVSLTF